MTPTNQPYILCPYCGHTQKVTPQCEQCHGLFEPLSRMATQIAMGPWFVRNLHQPFGPGCSFEILKKQIQAGKVTTKTIIKGPSTHQFWAVAKNVPGVATLLGLCHQCGHKVAPTDTQCSACRAALTIPKERNELGLQYPTAQATLAAQQQLNTKAAANAPTPVGGAGGARGGNSSPPVENKDLLDTVLASTSSPSMPPDEAALKASLPQVPNTQIGEPSSMSEASPPANQEEALDQQTRRLSAMTLVLVGFNVVMLILLILLWLGSGKEGKIAQTRPQPRRMGTTGSLERQTLPQTVDASSDGTTSALPLPQGSPQLLAVITKARDLENKDQMDEALIVLNQYVKGFGEKDLPFDLEVEIERLQQKATRQKTESLFRTP